MSEIVPAPFPPPTPAGRFHPEMHLPFTQAETLTDTQTGEIGEIFGAGWGWVREGHWGLLEKDCGVVVVVDVVSGKGVEKEDKGIMVMFFCVFVFYFYFGLFFSRSKSEQSVNVVA